MKEKNQIIEKLLQLGKKHKILVYPTLALVAIVSAFSYLYYWSKGSGKKFIATMLALVLFVSQSLFLTASASEEGLANDLIIEEQEAGLIQSDGGNIEGGGQEEPLVTSDAASELPTITSITAPAQTTYVFSTNTSEDVVKSNFPTTLTCTIHSGSGDYTSDLAVNWSTGSFSNSSYAECTYVPTFVNESSYTIDSTAVKPTLTAQFRDTYQVKFVNNGGTTSDISFPMVNGSYIGLVNETYQMPNNVRTGYTFLGWYDNPEFTGSPITAYTGTSTNSVTFYAKWDKVKVTYYGNGGITTDGDTTTSREVNTGEAYTIENVFTRTGYTFSHWLTDSNSGQSYDKNAVISPTSKVDLYAQWVPREYTVSFDSNGGTGTMSTCNYTYGSADVLPANTFTKNGYRFTGWSLTGGDSNSSSKILNNAVSIGNALDSFFNTGSDTAAVNVTLYAVWEKSTITFEENKKDLSLSLEYGDTIENQTIICDNYVGAFTYEIPDEEKTKLEEYGFSLQNSGNQLSITGTAGKITEAPITLHITTTAVGTDPQISEVLTVTLEIEPAVITLSGIHGAEKTYDGTAIIDINELSVAQAQITGTVNGDRLTIDLSHATAYFDTKDAGEGKTVYVVNALLEGTNSEYYTLGDLPLEIPGAGTINKKDIKLVITGDAYQYVGEAGPSEFVPEITLAEGYELCLDDTVDVFTMKYRFIENPLKNDITGYEITASAEADNYNVVSCDVQGRLMVKQDEAELDVNYSLSQNLENGAQWYTEDLVITPKLQHGNHYYDEITMDGGVTWVDSLTFTQESEYNGQYITIQMRNSETNAVTTETNILVQVDTSAPTYVSVSFEAGSGSLLESIGNFFRYGNFFKESIAATLEFEDNISGNDVLYYDLAGNGEFDRTARIKDNKVTIFIPDGTNNEVQFYAVDIAGNRTATGSLAGDADGNWWVVERTSPEIIGYQVKDLNGQFIGPVTDSYGNRWYNEPVSIVANILEADSGILKVEWDINGEIIIEETDSRQASNDALTYSQDLLESGDYSITVKAIDNAQNESEVYNITETRDIKLDVDDPIITVANNDATEWAQKRTISFTVEDVTSGVNYVVITSPSGSEFQPQLEDGVYSFEANQSGTYVITAYDKAARSVSVDVDIERLSTAVPDDVKVTVTPEEANGSENWYVTIPTILIEPVSEENGEAPVHTYYKLWSGENEPESSIECKENTTISVPSDGVWKLKVWAVSESGVMSAKTYEQTLYVDTEIPNITIDSTIAGNNSQTVKFIVVDNGSGVERSSIKVMYQDEALDVKLTPLDNEAGYMGSFEISSGGSYVIQADDIAGNSGEAVTYKPMTMRVNTVKDITTTSATVGVIVKKGTYNISITKIEYKEVTEENFVEVIPLKSVDEDGNVALSYGFTNLKQNTRYAYRVSAVSELGETLTYVGYFKTASGEETGANVIGQAIDYDNSQATIEISLLEGNTVLAVTEIASGEYFSFANVQDGNYNISATNGETRKNVSVTVAGGQVVDPTEGICIILRKGQNTSVLIGSVDTPNVSADGLESIFTYDSVNYTEADAEWIANGGAVEFCLEVNQLAAGSVPKADMSALYSYLGDKRVAGAYLDLSLWKIRTGSSGRTESKEKVSEISGGAKIRIVIPIPTDLQDKSDLRVVRIHNGVVQELADLDSSAKTYTIESSLFSTYAFVYTKVTEGSISDETQNTASTGTGVTSTNLSSLRTQGSSSYTNNGSPKTGDETPLAVLAFIGLISGVGFVILKKKIK